MSDKSNLNKKRRLESQASQISGITLLSNVTQTTDLSSDVDDSVSDSSSNNAGLSCNVADGVQNPANNSSRRGMQRSQRKRQVSWSADFDGEDETFLKSQYMYTPRVPPQVGQQQNVPYDNNFNGTNNSRRRTRRATESSLDTHGLSLFEPQSQLRSPTVKNNQFARPLRSNTTSQLHGHEDDIQRQRFIEGLLRQFDAERMHSRRSQSVTSLRDPNLHIGPLIGDSRFTPTNTYEPLLPRPNVPTSPNQPVDTVVTMHGGGVPYIHPVTNVQRQNRNEAVAMGNDVNFLARQDDVSNAGGSSYVGVNSGCSETSQVRSSCCHGCTNTFFRKGFFVLLALNVIFILVNVVGLPFIYVAMRTDNSADSPRAEAQTSARVCVQCDALSDADRKEFETSEQNNCCGPSKSLLQGLIKATQEKLQNYMEIRIEEKAGFKVPVVQLKADALTTEKTLGAKPKIKWDKRPEINTMGSDIVDGTIIKIPQPGYYYIYSRVHYEQDNVDRGQVFTIGHKVMKQGKDDKMAKQIDSIVQRCFPSSTTGDVRHTNHIGSVQYLKEDDRIFIQLDHEKFFDHDKTMFGMFLVAT